uniref:RING-type E3 ubiquitin transferase n=1 Tax=Clastoptera arizonana TaxID=38151 RepID=A0A1B6CJM0_9HEMI
MAAETILEIKWPKDFPELKALDDLLHCGICYGYIKTCMVTSCSHNYCSLCIRKFMQYKTQCPICFEETFECNLRNNRAIDQCVDIFSGIRDKLLRHLRIADVQLGTLPQVEDNLPQCIRIEQSSPMPNSSLFKKTKGESSRTKNINPNHTLVSPKTDVARVNLSRRLDSDPVSPPNVDNGLPLIPKMFLSPKKQTDIVKSKPAIEAPTVACPVCEVNIPERNINIHLDSCLDRPVKAIGKSPEKKKKRSPLAKMVYSMMSEKELKKKLKEHGLNCLGDKKALISRLQRFIVVYNSECDSENPRPVSDIIRQIEKEESGEKKAVVSVHGQTRLPAVNRKTDPQIIEEENKKYISENKDSFNALINAVRVREKRFVTRVYTNKSPEKNKIFDSESEENEIAKETITIEDSENQASDESDEEFILSPEYPVSPVLKSSTPARCQNTTPKQHNSAVKNLNTVNDEHITSKNGESTTLEKVVGKELFEQSQIFDESEVDESKSIPSPSCIDGDEIDSSSENSDEEFEFDSEVFSMK